MKAANRLVCISKYSRDLLPPGPRDRACIISNPFDTKMHIPESTKALTQLRHQLAAEPNRVIIGFFGNFMARKKPEVFIRALSKLHEFAPDLNFAALLFGEIRNDYQQIIRTEAEKGNIADRVNIIGFVNPPEPFMAACDILLAPAINEPFGRTLVEAMLAGTPIIASASGGHLEIIEHGRTGILFTPDDHEALARETLRILKNPTEAKKIASEARQHAVATYGIESHVAAMSNIFHGIIGIGETA